MAGELKRLAKKKPEVKMQLKKEDNKKKPNANANRVKIWNKN